MSVYEISIAIIGGLFAGGINTLAGNGSMITLTILTEVLGLSGNMANGTNRLGILLNGIGSGYGFYTTGQHKIEQFWRHTIPVILGAVAGVLMAVNVSNEQFLIIFRIMMIVLFFVILVKPKKWLIREVTSSKVPSSVFWILLLTLGFYGGFIQMGMGLLFLAVMVLVGGYPMMQSNVMKVFIILLYTIPVVAIFHWQGLINWRIGLILGGGQFVGGWLTSRYATKIPNIELWAYRLLVVMVLMALLKIFGVFG